MSVELSIAPPTASFSTVTPCGQKINYIDSKIVCQASWMANWFADLSLNTPLATNLSIGRLNCGASISSRGNFIGDVASYKRGPSGLYNVIEASSSGITSWVSSSSFPDPDGYSPIPQGCISNSAYAFNDKYANFQELIPGLNWTYSAKMPVWGLYVEVRQHAKKDGISTLTSGSTYGMEIDVISYGDGSDRIYPYGDPSYNLPDQSKVIQTERTIGIILSSGGGNLKAPNDQPQITDTTCAILVNGNGYSENGQYFGAKWKSGIVFSNTALKGPDFEAIAMCDKHKVNWYKSRDPNANDGSGRNQLGASVYGDATGNGNQMALSLVASNADGVQQEIAFNKYADNALCPQYPNISLGSSTPDNQWAELWTKKLIIPSTQGGGNVDGNGKPQYAGYTGEVRLAVGSVKRRLYICLGGNTWGRINITV